MGSSAIIGVDPGKTGGVALLRSDGSGYVYPIPTSELDLLDLFREIGEAAGTPRSTPATLTLC